MNTVLSGLQPLRDDSLKWLLSLSRRELEVYVNPKLGQAQSLDHRGREAGKRSFWIFQYPES